MRILIKRFLYRHPKTWGSMYLVAGCVHVLLGLILSAYGYRWALALIAAGALECWVAYQLFSALTDARKR